MLKNWTIQMQEHTVCNHKVAHTKWISNNAEWCKKTRLTRVRVEICWHSRPAWFCAHLDLYGYNAL